jgi:hypothetical protein
VFFSEVLIGSVADFAFEGDRWMQSDSLGEFISDKLVI